MELNLIIGCNKSLDQLVHLYRPVFPHQLHLCLLRHYELQRAFIYSIVLFASYMGVAPDTFKFVFFVVIILPHVQSAPLLIRLYDLVRVLDTQLFKGLFLAAFASSPHYSAKETCIPHLPESDCQINS